MSSRIKPYLSLWDKSFKETHTRSYFMTMQLSMHGLIFTIYNPDKNKYLGVEAYYFGDIKDVKDIPGKFDLILSRIEWFAYPFKKFKLLYQNPYSTLVPLPLFDTEQKSLYLGFNQPFTENRRIIYDTLKTSEAVNVYYIPNPVVEKVRDFWPNAIISHFSSSLIECLSLNYKNKTENDTLFLHVNDGSYYLTGFKNNKLLYHNSFTYNTKEDFIFFLLAAIEQLGYNPETVDLILLGKIEKSDEVFQMIHQYTGSHHYIEVNPAVKLSYVLEEMRRYRHYVLFNALQCEL